MLERLKRFFAAETKRSVTGPLIALHQAGRPLGYALDFSSRMLGTAVPHGFVARLGGRPSVAARAVMDRTATCRRRPIILINPRINGHSSHHHSNSHSSRT